MARILIKTCGISAGDGEQYERIDNKPFAEKAKMTA
jgi:hypothetical protein